MFDFFFTSTVCPRNIVHLYIVGTLLNLDKTSWSCTRYIYFSETIICRVAYSGSDLPDPISDPVLTLARNGSDPDPVRFYHFFWISIRIRPCEKKPRVQIRIRFFVRTGSATLVLWPVYQQRVVTLFIVVDISIRGLLKKVLKNSRSVVSIYIFNLCQNMLSRGELFVS